MFSCGTMLPYSGTVALYEDLTHKKCSAQVAQRQVAFAGWSITGLLPSYHFMNKPMQTNNSIHDEASLWLPPEAFPVTVTSSQLHTYSIRFIRMYFCAYTNPPLHYVHFITMSKELIQNLSKELHMTARFMIQLRTEDLILLRDM
jgi:hypothetical protein